MSSFGGRCPSCGTELIGVGRAPPVRRGPRRPASTERKSPGTTIFTLAGALVALGALGGGAWYLKRTSTELARLATASTAAPEPPKPAVAASDPLELGRALVAARRRAQAWHAEPHLVSLAIEGVDKGKIGDGGSIQLEFGKSKSGRLGPRSPVGPERLLVSVARDGQKESERKAAPARSVADPNCPLEEAWRKTVASGVPSNLRLAMRYELSKKHDRAVWQVSVPDRPELARTLDGDSCAILPR